MKWLADGMTPPSEGHVPESAHLRQDINIPEQATGEDIDPGRQAGSAASLNARQQVPGVSPVDEYRSGAADDQAGRKTAPEES